MKTLYLTQSRAQNDPINCQIQGLSFRDFKNKVLRSRCDFFLFSQPIIDFKHSLDTEMSLEDENSRDSHIVVSKHFDFLENRRTAFRVKEHFNYIGNFGRNSRMRRFDLING